MDFCEPLESRQLMSATIVAEQPESTALLLPAIQAAREGVKAAPTTTSPARTGPFIDVLYSTAGNSAWGTLQLVVM